VQASKAAAAAARAVRVDLSRYDEDQRAARRSIFNPAVAKDSLAIGDRRDEEFVVPVPRVRVGEGRAGVELDGRKTRRPRNLEAASITARRRGMDHLESCTAASRDSSVVRHVPQPP